ncbi:Protein C05G5.1 [Aphelenchoides avenae]|nr:Protein C05G5.1 [Aphelenchus avenae]
MYLPTKLASFWFPDSQRVIANTLGSMANPLGVAAMYALSPQIVDESNPKGFLLLTSIVAATALLGAALSVGVRSSKPPKSPSASSAKYASATKMSLRDFWKGVWSALSTLPFLVLFFALGSGVGLFNTVYNNLQPALCVKGYANSFSGFMGALMIVSGLIGSGACGAFVDKTRLFEEAMKICLCIAAVSGCSLLIALQYEGVEWWIAVSIAGFGAFGFAIYPVGLEMGVETTYPVPEATSSGLLIMMG